MFIINLGSKTYKYDSKRPKDIFCHNCKIKDHTEINKCLKYFYILYIPIFAFKFWTSYKCVRCNYSSEVDGINQNIKKHYDKFNSRTTLPIWTFSGLITLLAILIFL